ncbi:hypothetical protein JTM26_31340, partial [Pseudomonas aeruginosa]|nr:hypothetical protein [Pseudomonas aeruginosa]
QQKRVKPFKNRCFYDSDARFSELICKIDKFARLSDFVQRFPRARSGMPSWLSAVATGIGG